MKMLDKWLGMSDSDEVEIEVAQWYQNLTEETMTRTVFGNNYKDGKHIFQLQARQMVLTSQAFQKISIPGYRYISQTLFPLFFKNSKLIVKSNTSCLSIIT